jgi:hypothetical protein
MSTTSDIPATKATTGRFSVTARYDGDAPGDILTGLWTIIRGGGLHVDGNRITAQGRTDDDEDPRAIATAVAGAMTADNVAHMSVRWEQGSPYDDDENGDIPF